MLYGTRLKSYERSLSNHLAALAIAACLWPVWVWHLRRLLDGTDEPWGVAPLLIILAALFRQAGQTPDGAAPEKPAAPGTGDLLAAAIPLGIYGLSYHVVPPLVRGILGGSALSVPLSRLLRNRRFDPAVWGLLMLSLPAVASLQFYAGYPLRVAVARGAGMLLRLSGTGVHAAGAALRWGDRFVDVDGPCSGIKSLWTGALLVCLLAYGRRLRTAQVALFSAAAFGVVLLGNICRAAALFHLEVGTLPFARPWLHTGIGLVVFAGVALAIWGLSHLFPATAPRRHCAESPGSAPPSVPGGIMVGTLAVLCLVAALLPLAVPKRAAPAKPDVDWPETFEGRPLVRGEDRIPAGDAFPGSLAQFSDGTRQILFKAVSRPSRRVHPAADCYRGSGWRIHPAPLHIDGDGRHWSAFDASRQGRTVQVRELVTDSDGKSWSTISAWYWSAVFDRTRPPWTVIVVATPL